MFFYFSNFLVCAKFLNYDVRKNNKDFFVCNIHSTAFRHEQVCSSVHWFNPTKSRPVNQKFWLSVFCFIIFTKILLINDFWIYCYFASFGCLNKTITTRCILKDPSKSNLIFSRYSYFLIMEPTLECLEGCVQ